MKYLVLGFLVCLQGCIIIPSYATTSDIQSEFKKPLWKIRHVYKNYDIKKISSELNRSLRDLNHEIFDSGAVDKNGIIECVRFKPGLSSFNERYKGVRAGDAYSQYNKFAEHYPRRAEVMIVRIKKLLTNKKDEKLFVYYKPTDRVQKQTNFTTVYKPGSYKCKLIFLSRYYNEHISYAQSNKVNKKVLADFTKNNLINSVETDLAKSIKGTVYKQENVKAIAKRFVERELLDHFSHYDALRSINSVISISKSINSPSTMASVTNRGDDWRSQSLKGIMDKLGVSSGGKTVVAAKLEKPKNIFADKNLIVSAKKLADFLGGRYKYTPSMEKMHKYIAEHNPAVAKVDAANIDKLLSSKNDALIKQRGPHLLNGLRSTYARSIKKNNKNQGQRRVVVGPNTKLSPSQKKQYEEMQKVNQKNKENMLREYQEKVRKYQADKAAKATR